VQGLLRLSPPVVEVVYFWWCRGFFVYSSSVGPLTADQHQDHRPRLRCRQMLKGQLALARFPLPPADFPCRRGCRPAHVRPRMPPPGSSVRGFVGVNDHPVPGERQMAAIWARLPHARSPRAAEKPNTQISPAGRRSAGGQGRSPGHLACGRSRQHSRQGLRASRVFSQPHPLHAPGHAGK